MPVATVRHRIVVPISGVNNAVANTLRYARTLSPDITAVHIAVDPEAGAKVKVRWERWAPDIPLHVVESPYRALTEPLISFIEELDAEDPHDIITILVPEFVTHRWWHYLLHQQTALTLRTQLLHRKRWVVTGVPYHIAD